MPQDAGSGAGHVGAGPARALEPPLGRLVASLCDSTRSRPSPISRATSSTAASSDCDVARHEPGVVLGSGQQVADAEVAGAHALVPRHPAGRDQRVRAGQQHDLADGDRTLRRRGGERHRPAPPAVAALVGREVVGERVRRPRQRSPDAPRRPQAPSCRSAEASATAAARASSTALASRLLSTWASVTGRIVPRSPVGYVGAWAAALLVAAAACSAPAPTVPNIRPQVLAQLPHETTSFTEGLQRDGTALYESTGLAGESTLRELDPSTGAVRRSEPAAGAAVGRGHRGRRQSRSGSSPTRTASRWSGTRRR